MARADFVKLLKSGYELRMLTAFETKCPKCTGRGKLRVRGPDPKCPQCKGKRRIQRWRWSEVP
jgi:DnaJ-class molecular chaperone